MEQEEKIKKKEEEQMRKKQEKELKMQEKIKQREPVQEMKLVENPEERKKIIQKMKKHSDIQEEVTKKKKDEIKKEVLPKLAQKTETQLDVLYDLLEKNNSLKLTYIMQTFSINKEEAIEWCNILMGSGLAELKYPAFGDPILIKK